MNTPRLNKLAALLGSAVLAVSMVGCGGGSSSASAPTATSVSGVASKGPLNNALICAYAINNGIKGVLIGTCTTTDTNGNYTINLGSYTGNVLFETSGGSYIDEATGATVNPAATLHSMLTGIAGGQVTAAITALTEIAYQMASVSAGALSTTNIQNAITTVQNNFGVPDIITTMPVNALSLPAQATVAQKDYALALATVSQYLKGQVAGTTLANVLQTLQTCLSTPSSCGTVGSTLNTSMTTFRSAHTAFSGTSLSLANFGTTGGGSASPTITSFAPSSGAVGAFVTIVGTHFSATAVNNTVSFNGVQATVTNITGNQLTVTVPATATSGTVTVTVGGQTATSATAFTVSGAGGGGTVVGTQMGGARQGVTLNIAAGAGVVTTFAGSGADAGTGFFPAPANGMGTAATFSQPTGITTDGTNLYVADFNNARIRKIVIATGVVTTFAGSGGFGSVDGTGTAAGFAAPAGITTDGNNLYVADTAAGNIRKIVIATGVVTTLASGLGGFPYGITTDGINVYVSEILNTSLAGNKIEKIVISTGVVTTLAGAGGAFNGNVSVDGTGTAATFVTPAGLTTDGTNLYVAEAGNNKIRKIVIATGAVTTLAGQVSGGTADGTGTAAKFSGPYDITTDGTNLYVADSNNHTIRQVVIATGVVTTLAGSGAAGAVDATGAAASFTTNRGIVTDGNSLYVTDTVTHTIRKIQ